MCGRRIGMFADFIEETSVKLIGVEAAGLGIETGKHASAMALGKPGTLHGMRSYLLQDGDGNIQIAHSISACLDYPGVGPEHAYLKDSGRACLNHRSGSNGGAAGALQNGGHYSCNRERPCDCLCEETGQEDASGRYHDCMSLRQRG